MTSPQQWKQNPRQSQTTKANSRIIIKEHVEDVKIVDFFDELVEAAIEPAVDLAKLKINGQSQCPTCITMMHSQTLTYTQKHSCPAKQVESKSETHTK